MIYTLLLRTDTTFRQRNIYEALIFAGFLLSALIEYVHFSSNKYDDGIIMAVATLPIVLILPLLNALAISRLQSRLAAFLFLISLSLALLIISIDLFEAIRLNGTFLPGLAVTMLDSFAAFFVIKWLKEDKLKRGQA